MLLSSTLSHRYKNHKHSGSPSGKYHPWGDRDGVGCWAYPQGKVSGVGLILNERERNSEIEETKVCSCICEHWQHDL